MSRVGRQKVTVPAGAKINIADGMLTVEGPKGKVSQALFRECPVKLEDGTVTVSRINDSGPVRAKHGLTRALIANAVLGVMQGFKKELEIVGVGYKVEMKGKEAHFALGYSHPVIFKIPAEIDMAVDKNNKITITGADCQQVGQVAAEIRSLRKPDPYKAKGIRYSGEHIRRKVGKSGAR
jgi:large subunit ribosomal protein L6